MSCRKGQKGKKDEAKRRMNGGEVPIHQKLIIAHRGAPIDAKENTIESFERAIALGADMIEFDVRRTKDKVLIAYHDETIQSRPVKELTFEAISRIAGNQGFDIPTVEEVLRLTRGKIKLDVELKEEGYEKEMVELISTYFGEDQFVITSFYDASLRTIKDDSPRVRVGLILGTSNASLRTRISEFFPAKRCNEAKVDFMVPHWKLLRLGFFGRAERNKKSLFVWTVNDAQMIRKLLRDGRVDAIVTDKADLALSLRKEIVVRP
ncbi:MAG: glycerophosphodiester phosphodiesterase [Thermodesulfobacteriota bacterium]